MTPQSTVDWGTPRFHTHAEHVVHLTDLPDTLGLIPDRDGTHLVRPRSITLTYPWDSGLGHLWWSWPRIEVDGERLPAPHGPDPDHPGGRTVLLVPLASAPTPLIMLAAAHMPSHIVVHAPHTTFSARPAPTATPDTVPQATATTRTEVRHLVHDMDLYDAPPLEHLRRDHDEHWLLPLSAGLLFRCRAATGPDGQPLPGDLHHPGEWRADPAVIVGHRAPDPDGPRREGALDSASYDTDTRDWLAVAAARYMPPDPGLLIGTPGTSWAVPATT